MIRRVVPKPTEELSPMLSDLQLSEFIYEQPSLGELEYTFKHALTQEVSYNSVLAERRKALHERAGAAIEALHPGNLDHHIAELAHHYSRSANHTKAVEFLHRAAAQAITRSAYAQGRSHLNAPLAT